MELSVQLTEKWRVTKSDNLKSLATPTLKHGQYILRPVLFDKDDTHGRPVCRLGMLIISRVLEIEKRKSD